MANTKKIFNAYMVKLARRGPSNFVPRGAHRAVKNATTAVAEGVSRVGSKGLGSALRAVGLGAAVLAGTALATRGIEAIHHRVTQGPRFRRMLNENPDLKGKKEKDVRQMFEIIHQMSPELTKHPVVAGAFVRKAMEYKDVGVSPASVKELVDINLNIAKARGEKGQFGGMLRTMATAGALNAVD